MTDQRKKLAQMTPEEAAPIMEAWRTGKKLQYWLDQWHKKHPYEAMFLDGAYRIPPAEPTVHPALWEIVPEWCNFIAQNQHGDQWGYADKPFAKGAAWHADFHLEGLLRVSPAALSWPEGTPWQDRIIVRPGYEEGEG